MQITGKRSKSDTLVSSLQSEEEIAVLIDHVQLDAGPLQSSAWAGWSLEGFL
jgi:hypothetical protein